MVLSKHCWRPYSAPATWSPWLNPCSSSGRWPSLFPLCRGLRWSARSFMTCPRSCGQEEVELGCSFVVASDVGSQGGEYSSISDFTGGQRHISEGLMSAKAWVQRHRVVSSGLGLVSWVDIRKVKGTVPLLELTPRLRRQGAQFGDPGKWLVATCKQKGHWFTSATDLSIPGREQCLPLRGWVLRFYNKPLSQILMLNRWQACPICPHWRASGPDSCQTRMHLGPSTSDLGPSSPHQ